MSLLTNAQLQQAIQSAVRHHAAGRLSDAGALYRQVLATAPSHADALYGLGLIAQQSGQLDDAVTLLTQVAKLHPQRADVQLQLSIAMLARGDAFAAASAARRAIALHAQFAEAHSQLAVALSAAGKHEEAIAVAGRAVELRPDAHESHTNLGHVLLRAARSAEAAREFRRAAELSPDLAANHINLAAALDQLDDVEGSIESAERAMRLGAASPELFINVSSLYRKRMDYRTAVTFADRALALNPNLAAAHGSKGLALLGLGDYAAGFAEYEWRWRCDTFTTASRDFGRPMWDGSDPSGRTILVHTEQGFGDVIQFARYVPMLAARGAKVMLECHPSLRPLLQSLAGVVRVIPAGMSWPDFDMHLPLLSLPRVFGTTINSIPAQVPYLSADAARIVLWRDRVPGPGLKVGLTWWGNSKPDPARSCPLAALAPLAAVPGVTYFSLQKGDVPADAVAAPAGLRLVDCSKEIKDFSDTAAAIHALDLIITIDTAAAHLAGALGKPTWTLLPRAADWRWMADRADSPWYPTMRLFRQAQQGDWPEVARRVAVELSALVSRDRAIQA
jgi:tetratricopeptide (TPR) repeat protein